MGRPVRPDGRIAAAVAALGQNMLEGRRRRHPPVSTANHKPTHQQPSPLRARPTQGYPPQARRDDAAASSAFNAVSSPPASSAMPTPHKPHTPHTHHQVTRVSVVTLKQDFAVKARCYNG